MQKEEHHLAGVLRQNGYPLSFIRTSSQPPQATVSEHDEEGEVRKPPMVMIPYIAGVSEDIRRVCRRYYTMAPFRD